MPTALGRIRRLLREAQNKNRTARRRASGTLGRSQLLECRQLLSAKRGFDSIQAAHAAAQGPRVEPDRRDHRLQVDGMPLPTDTVSGATSLQAATPYDLSQTFLLNSLPTATKTIFLDFDGNTTSGTWWNSNFTGGAAFTTPAFSIDSNPAFSDADLTCIQQVWQRVAEDYAPFNINVTTQDPGTAAIVKSGSGDTAWGVHVVIGGSASDWYKQSAGGVAYLNTFGASVDMNVFAFANNLANNEKYIAEAVSHEAGHSFGLSHDGQGTTSYYAGHGSGPTGWAPLMGVGYYQSLTQWSQGEYPNATTTQDDLAIIASATNGVAYRTDDYGSTRATASLLTTTTAGTVKTVNQAGLIERRTDQDWFSFTTTGGLVSLNVNGAPRGSNLDIAASLYDASGTLILTSNPPDDITASFSTTLPAGTYYLSIDGVGARTLTDGYSDYGSLGQYVITGSIPDAPATPLVRIMDNGDAGYSTAGAWRTYGSAGRDGDWDYAIKSTGTGTATWAFDNLTPGQYRVSTTWGANPAFASNAQYTIRAASGGAVLGSSLINQQLAPNDLTDQGSAWEDLKTVTIGGSTLVVELTDTNTDQYVIADAIRIERIGNLSSGPEITVLDNGTDIASGTGTVSFGNAAVGQPIYKTITVQNTGSSDLILQPAVAPAGFTITTNFTSSPIPSGGTASLVVRLDATSLGSYSGVLSFATNDADENPFQFTVSGVVGNAPLVRIMDNGDPGYSTSGNWRTYGSAGRDGDWDYAIRSAGTGTATWTFDNLTPGQYRVSATWGANPAFASNAQYNIRAASGGAVIGSSLINQQLAPNDLTDQGSNWEDLKTVTIAGSTLVVELTNANTDQYVIADAIRIERIASLPSGPEIAVMDNGTDITSGTGTVNFGSAALGQPVYKTITVENTGSSDLILQPAVAPAGFTITTNFTSTPIPSGGTASLVVRLDATSLGSFSGTLSFATNDSDENPFQFTVSGVVGNAPLVRIIDNGDAGYSTSGNWRTYGSAGRDGDWDYAISSTGVGTATWTFDNLTPGQYRVSTTWGANPAFASNAQYTIRAASGGAVLGSSLINQQLAPNDLTDQGSNWEDLQTVTITGSTLVVELTNANTNQYVIADAVRIERIG